MFLSSPLSYSPRQASHPHSPNKMEKLRLQLRRPELPLSQNSQQPRDQRTDRDQPKADDREMGRGGMMHRGGPGGFDGGPQ